MTTSIGPETNSQPRPGAPAGVSDSYKWVALSNTTLGLLMAMINSSIVLIALPDIFRGIRLNPLTPGNSGFLLWMLIGFNVVTAVLVVSLGRLADMFGRSRMFNLGFATFTAFSILLSVAWMHGTAAALYLILLRIGQAAGASMLMANSSAILTDAFPPNQRGLALGINNVALIAGSFIGLIVGGLLGPLEWHLVFLVSVPFGLFGTFWSYHKLRDTGVTTRAHIDWWGNLTFGAGLVMILVAITYGILPYGGHTMGWTKPLVIGMLLGGILVLAGFCAVETRVAEPMFRLDLFRIRAFAAGNIANLLAALSRGGMMFIIVIWLQGVWLPQHGYSFSQTPLWAGIYMLPLTAGLLIAGPASGLLADRYGARPFATGGLVIAAAAFFLLQALPVNFNYLVFGTVLTLLGLGFGVFSAPNQAGIMNSLPPSQRGAGAGMTMTFMSAAQVLSIGIFFTLVVLGLSANLPHAMLGGLTAQGVDPQVASQAANLPPVGSLFASFLGYNPMAELLGPSAHTLPTQTVTYLTGRTFFPELISHPFHTGLAAAFDFAAGACLLAAIASLLRGGKHHYTEPPVPAASDAVRPITP